jgi:hypothetical protein
VIEYAGANSAHDATDPDLAGVDLDYYWSQIEPSKGFYDWDVITSAMAPWVSAGKKVILRIASAGQPSWDPPYSASGTPQWVYSDGATSVSAGGAVMPVYWSPAYLADLSSFVQAFAAEFDGNSSVAAIEASVGMGGETEPDNNLSDLSVWQSAGYADSLWQSTVQTILGYYRQDFSKTHVYVMLTSTFLDSDWSGYKALIASLTSEKPPWHLQNDALSATSRLPSPTNWAAAPGIMLEQAEPTSRSGDTLAADANNALSERAEYILVYRSDVTDPAYAATMSQLAALAAHNQ